MKAQQAIKAIVSSVDDPAKAGRIQCKFAQIDGQILPEWIEPVETPGWLWLPEIDDTVELLIPSPEDIVEFAHEILWRGRVRGPEETHPEELRVNYPKRKGFRTAKGMLFIIDETPGEEEYTFTHKNNILFSMTNDGMFFGTQDATEPVVLGLLFQTLLSDLLDADIVHTHPTGVGPSGPPLNAATYTALKATVTAGDQLSDFIFAQKVKP